MNRRSLVPVALAAACGNHAAHRYDPPPPSSTAPSSAAPTPATAPAPADCKAATDELGKFLTTMDHEGSLLNLDHVSPPIRSDLTIRGGELQQGPVIEVRTTGLFFQGDILGPAALGPKLRDVKAKIQHDIDAGYLPRS